LQLPFNEVNGGENQQCLVQLAVYFIFRTLPCLNHIREDMPFFGHIYDDRALAEQFYVDNGVAIWVLALVLVAKLTTRD